MTLLHTVHHIYMHVRDLSRINIVIAAYFPFHAAIHLEFNCTRLDRVDYRKLLSHRLGRWSRLNFPRRILDAFPSSEIRFEGNRDSFHLIRRLPYLPVSYSHQRQFSSTLPSRIVHPYAPHTRVDTFSNDCKSNGIALIVVACFTPAARPFPSTFSSPFNRQYHARLIILVEFLISRSITRPELKNRAGNLL